MSYFLYFGHLFIYLFFFLGFINLIFFIYVFLIFFSLHIKSNGYARLFSSLCSLRFLSHSRFLISLHTPRSDREERPTGGEGVTSGTRSAAVREEKREVTSGRNEWWGAKGETSEPKGNTARPRAPKRRDRYAPSLLTSAA